MVSDMGKMDGLGAYVEYDLARFGISENISQLQYSSTVLNHSKQKPLMHNKTNLNIRCACEASLGFWYIP